MRPPRRLTVALIALVAAGALPAFARAASPGHRADGKLADWRGTPTDLAGRTQLSRGELIYTDHLYDDYGPDLDGRPSLPSFRTSLAPVAGDFRYPDDPGRYGYNAADLRELRLAADARGLHALVALQTMLAPDAALATIAIDTDGRAGTGARRWPDGIGLHTRGVDRFITIGGAGGHVVDGAGRARALRPRVNLEANAIEVDVPWRLLGRIGPRARVWVVTGLSAGGVGYRAQRPERTAVFNVGFREAEPLGLNTQWADGLQAAALAKGDVAPFAHALPIAAMRAGATRRFRLVPGFYDRIFRARRSYGEGIALKRNSGNAFEDAAGSAEPMFRSPHQPYGLYVPRGYRPGRRTPLTIAGHSLEVNHNQFAAVAQSLLRELGDRRGSLVITPLARGTDTWYLDAGLSDVLEAWADARRHFGADPERTALTGYSMGGYLTYRLGLLMPDAFTAASVYVGPPAYAVWPYPLPPLTTDRWRVAGNTNLIVANALNLPFEINHGDRDELVPILGVVRQALTFLEEGDPVRFYRHPADTHLSFLIPGAWEHTRRWLGTGRRNRTPTRVRYRRYPAMDLPAAGLVFDHAYWVHDLAVRDAGAPDAWGQIDATTLARGGFERSLVLEHATLPAGGGASAAELTGQRVERGAPLPRRNGFDATLRNLGSVRFELAGMGIDPRLPVDAALRGDGPTTIRLSGDFAANVVAHYDGDPVPVHAERGGVAVTVDVRAGADHRLVLADPRV